MNARPTTNQPPLAYPDAERALLGGLIIDPDQLPEVLGTAPPSAWGMAHHRAVLELLRDMDQRGEQIDQVTVGERVAALGDGPFGELPYVLRLTEHCPSTRNLGHYAAQIREAAQRRHLVEAAHRIVARAVDPDVPPDQLVASLHAEADAALGDATDDFVWMSEAVTAADASMKEAEDQPYAVGVEMPYEDLAVVLPTLIRGEMHVVAARPAMGKSAFARGIAESVAVAGQAVGVFSLEMSSTQLALLTHAAASDVRAEDAIRGRLDADAWDRLDAAREHVAQLPIAVCDATDLDVEGLVARSHRLARACARRGQPLGLIVVDYLQLLKRPHQRGRTDASIVGDQSRSLKTLAKALNVPVLVLSQLNRDLEKRDNKRPRPSDLRDSGAIEQDAATITMLYRESVYREGEPIPNYDVAEALVVKNRYGRTGRGLVRFHTSRVAFLGEAP